MRACEHAAPAVAAAGAGVSTGLGSARFFVLVSSVVLFSVIVLQLWRFFRFVRLFLPFVRVVGRAGLRRGQGLEWILAVLRAGTRRRHLDRHFSGALRRRAVGMVSRPPSPATLPHRWALCLGCRHRTSCSWMSIAFRVQREILHTDVGCVCLEIASILGYWFTCVIPLAATARFDATDPLKKRAEGTWRDSVRDGIGAVGADALARRATQGGPLCLRLGPRWGSGKTQNELGPLCYSEPSPSGNVGFHSSRWCVHPSKGPP